MIELIKIDEEQEKAFPYWFAVFGLEPDYAEDGSLRWLERFDTECRLIDDLIQTSAVFGGIVSIVECDDEDPLYCSDDDGWSSSSGVYPHILQMRFKSPYKLNEAFQALSGFIGNESELFKVGKYPDRFDDYSGVVPGLQNPLHYLFVLDTKSWLKNPLDKAQELYQN
jgi:hypothetical protein